MRIANMSIMARIVACFVVLAAVVGASVWYAVAQMRAIDERYSHLLDREAAGNAAFARAQARVYDSGRIMWRMVATGEKDDRSTPWIIWLRPPLEVNHARACARQAIPVLLDIAPGLTVAPGVHFDTHAGSEECRRDVRARPCPS